MNQSKYDHVHIATAKLYAEQSHCPRTHVGCVVVTETGALFPGFNGMNAGGENDWEWTANGNPEVVHAELNSLGKMLESGVSAKGATIFVTLSPCLECSKLIVRSKIKRVVYVDNYRDTAGLDYLKKYNVEVEQYC
jgi:dCMP deaminase